MEHTAAILAIKMRNIIADFEKALSDPYAIHNGNLHYAI